MDKIKRKKQLVPNSFKYLLAVSSIAGTLGIWNLLANNDYTDVEAQNQSTETLNPTVDVSTLPTLVSLQKVDLSQIQQNETIPSTTQLTAPNPLRAVTRPTSEPVVQSSSPVILDSSTSPSSTNQSAPAANPPSPVTTTQSSKP